MPTQYLPWQVSTQPPFSPGHLSFTDLLRKGRGHSILGPRKS